MATVSEPTAPVPSWRALHCKRPLTVLFAMLVCMLGLHMSVSAFEGGTGKPVLPADPDLTKSKFVIVKNNSFANGLDENIVSVIVVDKDDNPLPGVKVTFFLPDGSTQNFLTGADGTYSFSLGRTTVGSATLSVTIGNSTAKKTVTVNFRADDPTVNIETTKIVILKGTAIANGDFPLLHRPFSLRSPPASLLSRIIKAAG
jgi:Big-like domain-containing protein